MQVEIDLSFRKAIWPSFVSVDFFAKLIEVTLCNFASLKMLKIVQVCVLLTNNNYMKELNSRYRKKNKATNVLSFPELNIDYKKIEVFSNSANKLFLGTIALGHQIIAQEAKLQNITFADHLKHLVVHGTLHLLGFDHEQEHDAAVMESLEQKILSNLSINKK